jgi:hypothetical protein
MQAFILNILNLKANESIIDIIFDRNYCLNLCSLSNYWSHSAFWLANNLNLFFLEATYIIELLPCRNVPDMKLYNVCVLIAYWKAKKCLPPQNQDDYHRKTKCTLDSPYTIYIFCLLTWINDNHHQSKAKFNIGHDGKHLIIPHLVFLR